MCLKGYHCEVLSFSGSDTFNVFFLVHLCVFIETYVFFSLERVFYYPRLFAVEDSSTQPLPGLRHSFLHCMGSGTFHWYFQYPLFYKKIYLLPKAICGQVINEFKSRLACLLSILPLFLLT